jgi:membrane associated rhomboid family serine protease
MSRAAETLASIPPATRLIVSVCALTYVIQVFLDPPLTDYALNPAMVLRDGQFYRLVTGALFHANLLHIVMNVTSTVAIGGMLERRIGTLMTLLTICWGILLVSSTYVLVSWLAHVALGLRPQNCVGFSGVIFQLSVLESNFGPGDRTRSVFGVVEVSSRAYPWALLLALQFMMPHVSFLGHLSGILIGTMQCRGSLDALFPSSARLRGWEASGGGTMAFVAARPGYVPVQESDLPGSSAGGGGAPELVVRHAPSLAARFRGIASGAREGVRVAVFGRGADANANIQMGELLGAAWGSGDVAAADSAWGSGGGGDVEDDDEWVGLPAAIHRSTEER